MLNLGRIFVVAKIILQLSRKDFPELKKKYADTEFEFL